jgi:hypothetical protein
MGKEYEDDADRRSAEEWAQLASEVDHWRTNDGGAGIPPSGTSEIPDEEELIYDDWRQEDDGQWTYYDSLGERAFTEDDLCTRFGEGEVRRGFAPGGRESDIGVRKLSAASFGRQIGVGRGRGR